MTGICRERTTDMKPEQRETFAKMVEHTLKRDSGKVWVDSSNSATGDVAIPRGKSKVSIGLKAEHGCGDRSPRSICKVRDPEPGTVTILRRGKVRAPEPGTVTILRRGKAPLETQVKNRGSDPLSGGNEPIVTIRLPGGGPAEPGRAPLGGGRVPPKRREEWIPYTSSTSNPAPTLPDGSKGKSQGKELTKKKGSKGRQKGQGGSKLRCPPPALTGTKLMQERDPRWYSSSPPPDQGAMPFRRKRSVNLEAGVSWADDEYWLSWNGWDEVIQWGDEKVKRKQKTKGGQREGSRETQRKKSCYQDTPLSDSIRKSNLRKSVTSEK